MSRALLFRPTGWPWPAPALAAWAAAWLAYAAGAALQLPATLALAGAMLVPGALAWRCAGAVRRGVMLAGFPLSLMLVGPAGVPAWVWLLGAGLLLAVYPMPAWRDAPLFPTPARALDGLARRLRLPAEPRILDAGCGLGHGLQALAAQWPRASSTGLERSRALAWLARRRCPRSRIVRGDMWHHPWEGYDLVYLFQRPETMARAWRKALREMRAGSWLVSLEFAVDGVAPQLCLRQPGERPVFAYQLPQRRPGALAP